MAKAIYRHIMTAPNKVRRVANLLRGKSLAEAEATLASLPQRAVAAVAKTLKSAAANAENNEGANRDALFVSRIFVDEGTRLRRYLPRARGRADTVRKRMSHLTVVVEPREVKSPAAGRTPRTRKGTA